MKNKSKLAKQKSNKSISNNMKLPDGWFVMCCEDMEIAAFDSILGKDYDVEIWKEAGVAEVTIGEKASVDIERIECDLGDEFSNFYLKDNNIKALFYLSFKREAYELAKPVLEAISKNISGFVCGDTDNFSPKF